jgi:hypothetical protein
VNASLARMYALPVVVTVPTVASLIRPGQGPSSRARRRKSPAHGGRYGEKVALKAGPVGRDDVLAELRRVVDGAVAGRGDLLLLAESRIQPMLLLLDDLQWADQPSQLLLDFLARRLPAGAVAVAGS